MRILITGVKGFVGRHLLRHLQETTPDADVHGTVFGGQDLDAEVHTETHVHYHPVDLRDDAALHRVIAAVQPEQIYHLAAQARVGHSYNIPWQTLENNIRGQLNLLTACVALKIAPRILIVSSGEIYGTNQRADHPTPEDTPFCPLSPYSVSKVTQDMLGLQYHRSHSLPLLRARPFNHLGPGQSLGFVVPDFATQIAQIEAGQQPPLIQVGDLSAERDFTDVRDIARAYYLIMERGAPGDVYNVCSGQAHSIAHVLDRLLALTDINIQIMPDPARMRPANIPKS
ncbi:MAG: NAD-dependent epimerase/dehydratase family protein, partial [Chloroflexi bacterium]|nr:NAD-dependent epimerase/dehydratase family protein [Chloroflexota bacterium]